MSLAPRFTASVRIRFTSLTMGASSAAFSSSDRPISSSSACSSTSASAPSVIDIMTFSRSSSWAGAIRLLDALQDRAFRRHHRLDVEAGHELDIVHGEHIGGIHHGDGQRGADPAERQHLVALGGLVGDQLDDRGINFEIGKIDGGNAVLAGEKVGDVLVGEIPQLDQDRPQPGAGFLLDLERLIQLLQA